jgi:regulator of cell morphogenesis and NO signaling
MYNLSSKTLSQIVTDNYQTARVFEKYSLDFCCKGKRSLESACVEFNLPIEDILDELSEMLGDNEKVIHFEEMSLAELTAYIVRVHHTYVKLNAPMILNYVLKVATKHDSRYPYMIEVYTQFSELIAELLDHMEKEEKVLFPQLVAIEKNSTEASITEAIADFEDDHSHSGSIMENISRLTNNYEAPEQACTTFRLALQSLKAFQEDLHKHVHLENNILFPKAEAMLNS